MRVAHIASLLLAVFIILGGCTGIDRAHQAERAARDRVEARRLVRQGNEAFSRGDLEAAEDSYRSALRADAFSGAAYNNLGRVYFKLRKLYAAAQAFERAARLLPHHAEPRNNLGLVLESAGRFDEAVAEYDRALAHQPDNFQLMGNLARALVRRGDEGEEVRTLLEQVSLEDDRPRWRQWARLTLLRFERHDADHEPVTR